MDMASRAAPLIHIGYHKTGTSFLQAAVFTDADRYCLPWGRQAGQAVEWFVLAHPQRFSGAAVRAAFDRAAGDCGARVPVISHEALSGHPNNGVYYLDRVVGRLAETFPDARIMIGTREQKALLVSLYYQYVRRGGTLGIDAFLPPEAPRPAFRPRVRLDHFEYDLTLEAYATRFARENLLVMPMELLQRDPDAYIARLCGFLGIDPPAAAPAQKVNASSPDTVMRLERVLNRYLPPPSPRPADYADFPLPFRIRTRLLRLLGQSGPVRRSGSAERARIKAHVAAVVGDHFADSNRRLDALVDLDMRALGYV
ncbi:hypothetical protein Ga0609869_003612 [Rhodovulum iodosum]|uniref:Sulfotransferase domain-containing protein n=1 Tax=Rhodovulum iodosum TaxID=68291 RepID=A0ABV3XY64_9RHOB|nr:sulfotransferase domain-containing protein [Rhodovulum robiginosum]